MALKFTRENPGDRYGIWVARTADPYYPYTVVQTAAGYFVTVGVDGAGKGARLLDEGANEARGYTNFKALAKAKAVANTHHERDLRDLKRTVKIARPPHPQELFDWLESLPDGYTFKRKANLVDRHTTRKGDVVIKRGALGNTIRPGGWPGWYIDSVLGFSKWSRGRAPGLPGSMLVDGGTNTVWDNMREVILPEFQERKAKPKARRKRLMKESQ